MATQIQIQKGSDACTEDKFAPDCVVIDVASEGVVDVARALIVDALYVETLVLSLVSTDAVNSVERVRSGIVLPRTVLALVDMLLAVVVENDVVLDVDEDVANVFGVVVLLDIDVIVADVRDTDDFMIGFQYT
jgi:hypothetical protein